MLVAGAAEVLGKRRKPFFKLRIAIGVIKKRCNGHIYPCYYLPLPYLYYLDKAIPKHKEDSFGKFNKNRVTR